MDNGKAAVFATLSVEDTKRDQSASLLYVLKELFKNMLSYGVVTDDFWSWNYSSVG